MKVVYLTASQSGATDQGSNLISVFNILENFTAPTFPVAFPVTIIAIFERDLSESENPEVELVVKMEGQPTALFERPLPFSFQGKKRARVFGMIQSIAVPGPGILSFQIKHRSKSLASWDIEVEQGASALKVQTEVPNSQTPKRPKKKKVTKKIKKNK